MKKCVFILFFALLALSIPAKEDVVKVSSFGFDAKDSTKIIQKAIDSGAKKVIFDKCSSPWVSGPLKLRSNQEIYLEDGVLLTALPGAFIGTKEVLFLIEGEKNILIHGGKDARIQMRKKDYMDRKRYASGEWRHVIAMWGAENITVKNIRLSSSGGDGIYIASKKRFRSIPSRNILVENVLLDDHYRQGISVIAVIGLTIRNCMIRDTSGAAPQAGIDFEPNRAVQQLQKILVEKTSFINNAGGGIVIAPPCDTPVDITVRDCRIIGGTRGLGFNRLKNVSVKGKVLIENCSFTDVKGDVFIFRDHTAKNYSTIIRNCLIRNKKSKALSSPLSFTVNTSWTDQVGNIHFDNLQVEGYEKSSLIDLKSWNPATYLAKMTGNIRFNGKNTDPAKFIASGNLDKPRKGNVRIYTTDELIVPSRVPKMEKGIVLRKNVNIILVPDKSGKLEFSLKSSGHKGRKVVMKLLQPNGEIREFTDITKNGTYTFSLPVPGKKPYILMLEIGRCVTEFIPGKDLVYAISSAGEGYINLHKAHRKSVYYHVPAGVKEFSLELSGDPTEPVSAEILDPAGKKAAGCENLTSPKVITVNNPYAGKDGIWQVKFTFITEDAYIRLHAPLLPLLTFDRESIFRSKKK